MRVEKIKIVIADDSAIIRGILEKALDANGDFEIIASVSNGRKAIDAIKYNPVDIIISDIDMPELNGIEAAKIITAEHNIPVVIFSEDRELKTRLSKQVQFFLKKNLLYQLLKSKILPVLLKMSVLM